MGKIAARTVRKSARKAKAGARRARMVVLPKPEKRWLLAGTALVTGAVAAVFAGSIATSTPAAAACSLTQPVSSFLVQCAGQINDEVEYNEDTDFDDDIQLVTDETNTENGIPTFINSEWDGIDIDATETAGGSSDDTGYDIWITVNDMTGIKAGAEGVQARTNDDGDRKGNIWINQHGFIEALDQDGVQTQVENGTTWIENTGIIGVRFIDALQVGEGPSFTYCFSTDSDCEGTTYELVDGDAFNTGANGENQNNVGGHGISAESGVGGSPDYGFGTNGDIYAANYGGIFADEDGIHTQTDIGNTVVYNGVPNGEYGLLPGIIDAQEYGMWSESEKGGNITQTNGTPDEFVWSLSMDTVYQSVILAGGEHGMHADSTDNDGDTQKEEANAEVEQYNFGYVETFGYNADAVAWARTDSSFKGWAGVLNGAALICDVCVEEEYWLNPNARMNGYDIDVDGDNKVSNINLQEANGIEVRKTGNPEGDLLINGEQGKGFLTEEIFSYGGFSLVDFIEEEAGTDLPDYFHFTTFSRNYGTWDFEAQFEGFNGGPNYLSVGPGGPVRSQEFSYPDAETWGGVFAAGSAWLNRNYSNGNSGLWNYGTLLGQGSSGDPVIDSRTAAFELGVDSESEKNPIPNFLLIGNAGYMEHEFEVYDQSYYWGSCEYECAKIPSHIETYATYGVMGSLNTPDAWQFSAKEAFQTNFGYFGPGGVNVNWDFIENTLIGGAEQLVRFGDAASDYLIEADGPEGGGAPTIILNEGLMLGNMRLDAVDGAPNFFFNTGSWFTGGTTRFYGEEDYLFNFGLTQAAFDPGTLEETEFRSLNETFNYGVFSLLDGSAGDDLTFDGDYYGSGDGEYELSSALGHFALDAFLEEHNSDDKADEFHIGYLGAGETALIVRNENTEGSAGPNQYGIDVVTYEDFGGIASFCSHEDGYGDELCAVGDTMYISEFSPNYHEAIGSVIPLIADGLYDWALWHDPERQEFELRSDFGFGSVGTPYIVTGGQFLWYELLRFVPLWDYAGQFNNSNGGADIATDYAMTDYSAPADSHGTRSGVWVKGVGSWVDTDTTQEVGLITYDTSFQQDIYGVLGGADMKPFGADSPVRVGAFGGYVTSDLDFKSGVPGSKVEYQGPSFGGYLAYNNGAFYMDVTGKAEILDASYHYSFTEEADVDQWSAGLVANAGYRATFGMGFLEPLASFAYVHTDVDDFADSAGNTVSFSNGESIRAGGGARLGAYFPTGGGTTEFSVLGMVWNEFEGDNTTTITPAVGDPVSFTDDTSGVFGEAEATLSWTDASGRRSAFLSGGGKLGENFWSANAQAGVRLGF